MRKLIPLILVVVAIVALACGSETIGLAPEPTEAPGGSALSPADEAAAPETAEVAPAETRDAAPTEMVETEPEQATARTSGGTFRRLWADPPTLDPHLTSDTTSAALVVEIFSGLVSFNPDLELVPDIASRWDISDDGLTYTFHLRPEAKFHDGKPVTAHDFKWSFERAVSPDLGSPVAETYLGDIVGVKDVLDGIATEISGVKVIDDHTLQVTIDKPKAYFLAKMAYHTAFVVDQANVEAGGRNWTDNPNGTGAFKLKEYRIGERIVFERNADYYLEPAHLDQVVMNLAGGQAMAMYENDEIDLTGVGLFDLERVQDPNEPLNKEYVVVPPGFSVTYIGFNTNLPPFDDLNFRQALNHAVDKELIATEVLAGLRVPAYGILPPGFPGYNPDLQGLKYDPELAQQLLETSRYSTPDSYDRIIVTVPGTGGTIGLDLEVIIEMWRQTLGVEVEIQQVEWATYLEDLNQQKFQAFAGLGWSADYPDPQDFLDILFHSQSEINHGAYSNTQLDDILEEARVEPDVPARMALYNQAEEMIVEDAAWVPLWFTGERHALVKPHIKDYKLTPMILPKLRYVYIGN